MLTNARGEPVTQVGWIYRVDNPGYVSKFSILMGEAANPTSQSHGLSPAAAIEFADKAAGQPVQLLETINGELGYRVVVPAKKEG